MIDGNTYDIDTANQLNNSWYKDSVVGIYSEKENFFYSILIPTNLKLKIKDKLNEYSQSDIICNLQAYLVFLLIKNKEDYFLYRYPKNICVCPDVRPIPLYLKCISKCFALHGKSELYNLLRFKLKKCYEKSRAHPKVRKVFQKKKRASYIFELKDMNEFIDYFLKFSNRKIRKG